MPGEGEASSEDSAGEGSFSELEWPLAEFSSSLSIGQNATPSGWLLSENSPRTSVTFASPTRWLALPECASQEGSKASLPR